MEELMCAPRVHLRKDAKIISIKYCWIVWMKYRWSLELFFQQSYYLDWLSVSYQLRNQQCRGNSTFFWRNSTVKRNLSRLSFNWFHSTFKLLFKESRSIFRWSRSFFNEAILPISFLLLILPIQPTT